MSLLVLERVSCRRFSPAGVPDQRRIRPVAPGRPAPGKTRGRISAASGHCEFHSRYDNANRLVWVEKRATDGGTLLVRDDFKYDVFGNITAETNSAFSDRYKWTAREFDSEIGLQYNRAREYGVPDVSPDGYKSSSKPH